MSEMRDYRGMGSHVSLGQTFYQRKTRFTTKLVPHRLHNPLTGHKAWRVGMIHDHTVEHVLPTCADAGEM